MTQTRTLARLLSLLLALGLLFGLAQAQPQGDPDAEAFRTAFLAGELSWDDVMARAAEEGEVNWFHWGGSDELNTWIDQVVVPDMAALGVELKTSRIPNTRDAVDLVLADAAAGRGVGEGSVDAIWINGENFLTLSRQELNFGPVADKLPNSQYFFLDPMDPRSGANLFDFGFPNNLEEVPWSGRSVHLLHRHRPPEPRGRALELHRARDLAALQPRPLHLHPAAALQRQHLRADGALRAQPHR